MRDNKYEIGFAIFMLFFCSIVSREFTTGADYVDNTQIILGGIAPLIIGVIGLGIGTLIVRKIPRQNSVQSSQNVLGCMIVIGTGVIFFIVSFLIIAGPQWIEYFLTR